MGMNTFTYSRFTTFAIRFENSEQRKLQMKKKHPIAGSIQPHISLSFIDSIGWKTGLFHEFGNCSMIAKVSRIILETQATIPKTAVDPTIHEPDWEMGTAC